MLLFYNLMFQKEKTSGNFCSNVIRLGVVPTIGRQKYHFSDFIRKIALDK